MRLLVMADGRSIHTRRWCRFFEDEGWEVALFTLEADPQSKTDRQFTAGHPTGIGLIDYHLALGALRRAVDSFKPDLISAHYVVSYGWLASYLKDVPTIVTAWGSDLLILPQKSVIHRLRIARALRHAAFCTVDNRNLQAAAERFIPEDRIITARMGVERNWFESCRRNKFNTDQPLRIIAPRGLNLVYDPETIIKAASILLGRMSCRITALGAEEMIPIWRKYAARQGVITILNFSPSLPHAEYLHSLSQYDIYVSASQSDSTSVALLEAMAAGLYPIVSDIEGNREWIRHGENGMLFKTGSADSLAKMIAQVQGKRQLLSSAAEMNRRLISEKAIWQDNMMGVKSAILRLVS